jgi:hypothetical protein
MDQISTTTSLLKTSSVCMRAVLFTGDILDLQQGKFFQILGIEMKNYSHQHENWIKDQIIEYELN